MNSLTASAAEWSATPSLNTSIQHTDNVSMRSTNEESSSAYTVSPLLDLDGRQENWDLKLRSQLRSTRYTGIDYADSDNYFFNLGGGYSTEKQRFALDSSFTRNTSFDTDFETQTSDAGLAEFTERESSVITPSWTWNLSETGTLYFSLSSQDVEYDEVSSFGYKDYQLNSAFIKNIWSVSARSQLGFSMQYQTYETEKASFDYLNLGQVYDDYTEFDNQSYRLEYAFLVGENTRLDTSIGKRRTSTTFHGQPIACLVPFGSFCLQYEIGDVQINDDGADFSLDFSHSNEVSSFKVSLSRMVQPASFGGAQESDALALRYEYSMSERLKTRLLLEATETTSIDGLDAVNDRQRYRIEPKLSWRLAKDLRLDFTYRHLRQTLTQTNVDSQSNLIIVGLNMTWPKLFSTF